MVNPKNFDCIIFPDEKMVRWAKKVIDEQILLNRMGLNYDKEFFDEMSMAAGRIKGSRKGKKYKITMKDFENLDVGRRNKALKGFFRVSTDDIKGYDKFFPLPPMMDIKGSTHITHNWVTWFINKTDELQWKYMGTILLVLLFLLGMMFGQLVCKMGIDWICLR